MLALSLLLLASGTCRAQSYVWQWQAFSNAPILFSADASSMADTGAELYISAYSYQCSEANNPTCYSSYSNASCTPSGAPTSSTASTSCTAELQQVCTQWGYQNLGSNWCATQPGHTYLTWGGNATATDLAQAQKCSQYEGAVTAAVVSSAESSTPAKDSNGCMVIQNPPGTGVCVTIPAGQLTGTSCSVQATGAYNPGTATGASPAENCVSAGGKTACVQTSGSGAGQCGTFNGDQVCPASLPNDSCVFYASGGSACSVSGTTVASGAPTDASGGAAAVTGTVTSGTGPTGGAASANYYSSSTVASSSTTVTGSSGGANVGDGGSASSSGSSGGSGSGTPSAANGDCGAQGVDCSTSGNPFPTYDWSSDSWSGATSSFWSAVSGGPIGSAVSGIASGFPAAGSCPGLTYTFTTIQVTADFGTTLCGLWENQAAPVLSVVMLAIWSILGVLIFLSA